MPGTYHEVHLQEDPSRRVVWHAIAEYLARFIPKAAAVLELGAGYCDWINHVQARVRFATDQWEGINRFAVNGVKCLVGEVRTVLESMITEGFDAVLASNFFEHFSQEELDSLLDQVWNRLNENGVLVVIQPNFTYAHRHYFDDYTHRSIFSAVSLQALLRSKGFHILHVEPRFLPLTMKSRLPKWRWLVKVYLRSPVKPLAGQMLVIAQKRYLQEKAAPDVE